MKHSSRAVRVSALCAAVLTLVACKASLTDSAFKTRAEAHIRSNIGEISTRSPVLGGTFQVRTIEWVDDDTVRIVYDDGHIELIGTADVRVNDDNAAVIVSRFRIVTDNDDDDTSSTSSRSGASKSSFQRSDSSSSTSSVSSRSGAGAGEFCGGIAGIMCDSGLTCDYDGTYPDAGGTCVES